MKYIKELYDKLASTCGITQIDNRITLRWNGKDGKSYTAAMIVTDISEYTEEMAKCYSCDVPDARFTSKLTLELCCGPPLVREVKLCYDCW